MNYERVKLVIDSWDPIDLLYFAPKNEYDFEIKRILELTSQDDTVEFVGNIIYKVFLESFGDNTFTKNLEECIGIAKQLTASN
ncbi:DUF1871 family protein [Proteiniclasticum sp. BAD-10]|jgi:hypothetical protein|uniref:DUF1871 family protein n=1 Tax=Proteiniclasticum sediminis TaxID=2804028 RepID=A0A941CSB5_9CLOT|nr:DUF1871 family protein [Proteiniclasticum sediminis]MBR0577322.1 DUF1871 family protein [Proteiniclasticum sediminis]